MWTCHSIVGTGRFNVDCAGDFAKSEDEVRKIFRENLETDVDVDDVLRFDPDSVRLIQTQEGGEYRGFELRVTARMGGSNLRTKIDLGFGERPDHDEELEAGGGMG